MSAYIEVEGSNPYLELTGTESSADPVGIREKAGNLELYDVGTDTAKVTLGVSSGDLAVAGGLTVTTAKTDGQIGVPIAPGVAISGTWTASDSSNVLIVTRSTNVATEYYKIPIMIPHRTTSLKGVKLKSVTVSYSLGSTDTTNDDMEIQIVKQTIPANGSAATGSILAGDADADYDSSHDTKAKRLASSGAPTYHTATVTIPTGEQAYMATGEQYWIRIKVTDNSSANLALILTGAIASYDVAQY